MGRYSKQATKDQIETFSDVFEKSLLDTYTSTLIEFKDEEIRVLKPESESKHKDKAIVKIEIVTSTKVYPGRYSMYLDKESNWKIRNININGMNLAKDIQKSVLFTYGKERRRYRKSNQKLGYISING